jgi:competence protein ComEC
MSIIHFLNVLDGDCNIIQHDSGRTTVIDVSNATNDIDTPEEKTAKSIKEKDKLYTGVPSNKRDYKQKATPDNPIQYLNGLGVKSIFRFILTHPDMDHMDGIEDLYNEFEVTNTWDTDNTKKLDKNPSGGRYNPNDWNFYTSIRDGKYPKTKRLALIAGASAQFYNDDHIQVLAPTPDLIKQANESSGDYHDLSYVLLYTPPKKGGGHWKIIFAGDSHDATWDYIAKNNKEAISNIDVLIAPHHGRDSDRDYSFLKVLNPGLTLFGNAGSEHLAYNCYPKVRITNNQAGYVILDVKPEAITIYVKNREFAEYIRGRRSWSAPSYNSVLQAYELGTLNRKN